MNNFLFPPKFTTAQPLTSSPHFCNSPNLNIMSEEAEESKPLRRMVVIIITPKASKDPAELYTKIKAEVVNDEYQLEWQESCEVKEGQIYTSFTIGEFADFHDEVIYLLECMEDDVAKTHITFQSVME
jgi:hypothetical protein